MSDFCSASERLNAGIVWQTGYTGNFITHHCGDINLPYADWNGNAGGNSGTQALINSLEWEKRLQ